MEVAEKVIQTAYGLVGTGATQLKIVLEQGAPYGELAHVGGTAAVLELHIDLTDFADGDWENGTNNLGKGFYDDRIIAHEMTHAVMDDALGVVKMNNMPLWFIEGTAEFIPGADERLKDVIGTGGVLDLAKVDALVTRATDLLNGAAWQGDNQDYAAGYVIVKYLESNLAVGKSFVNVMADIKSSAQAGDQAVKDAIVSNTAFADFNAFVTDFSANAANFITSGISLDWGADETDTGSILGSGHGGMDVSTSDKAGAAIQKYDTAIQKVSTYRAQLGAWQNRLEHTIANLANASENLTAAESRIRYVDMAKEMMNFQKSSILAQAAQAMLANANQQPQSVLQLLR